MRVLNRIFLIIFFVGFANLLPAQQTLKVMSYNIHHCNPPTKPGLIDVDTVAGVIKKQKPDIVMLQEVDVNTARSGNINQAAQLSFKTGLKYYYFAKAIDYDGGDYGVAILSKYPLSNVKTYRLPMEAATKGEPRVVAMATIKIKKGKQLSIASTHLDAQKAPTNRLLQIAAIDSIASKEKSPIIIAGDFNAAEGDDVIKQLDKTFNRTCTNCAFTIPVIFPKKAIDFIAYKPTEKFSVVKHEVIKETYASDHLPIIVLLDLK